MDNEEKPIRIVPSTPVIVTHREPVRVVPKEPIIVGPNVFLRQETAEKRGINSCVPTSVVNAAIGLELINTEEGRAAYQRIMDELLTHKDVWNGANLTIINTGDQRLANIIETNLPVRIGYQHNSEKMMLVPRTFDDIRKELISGVAHVISDGQARHAYASIRGLPEGFLYIDPLQPARYSQATADAFPRLFSADNNGWVTATLVRPA